MRPTFSKSGVSELVPRYVFAEKYYVRKRVLEVGAVASTQGRSAQHLVDRGARYVVACDDSQEGIEAAKQLEGDPRLTFRVLPLTDLEDGSFDFIAVADLAAYVQAPALLEELRRLLTRNGILMGALRNPSGLALSRLTAPDEPGTLPTLGQLKAALLTQFSQLETVTQSPFLGYQLAFESGDGLVVDGSLVGSVEAAYFVVLGGNALPPPQDPTWVQLPPEPLAYVSENIEHYASGAREAQSVARRLNLTLMEERTLLGQSQKRIEQMEAEINSLREGEADYRGEMERLRKVSLPATREVDHLSLELYKALNELEAAREQLREGDRLRINLNGEISRLQSEVRAGSAKP